MKTIFTKHQKLRGDTLTPISAFLNLRDSYVGAALFESSDHSSKQNSKSFICVDPIVTIKAFANQVEVRTEAERHCFTAKNLIEEVELEMGKLKFIDKHLTKLNGFFGVFGYDTIPQIESIKFKAKTRFKSIPDLHFSAFRFVAVFDNFTNQIDILMNSFDSSFLDFEKFKESLFQTKVYQSEFKLTGPETSNENTDSMLEKMRKAKEAVRLGEVFQLVVSQGFNQPYQGDPFEMYRELRILNPSPYMFYYELDNAKLIGASPEAQFRVKNEIAEIHPIAGTVKRTGSQKIDAENALALSNDPKENAEHTMLVDLARNDLNINCEEVRIEKYKEIQYFSHVIHMVSKVTGRLKEVNSLAAFAGTFPAGTLSGAPKYRAIELIDEFENENRGFYGGAIGQITSDGDLNMAIVIRSALAHKQHLFFQAGAGVVIDSEPVKEVEEIQHKVSAVRKAIKLAANKND